MARRRWHVRREVLVTPDGHRRWDRAYQSLLRWTAENPAPVGAGSPWQMREAGHERGDLCAGLDVAAGAGADD